jgi:DAK2 domain fusion protein YloV
VCFIEGICACLRGEAIPDTADTAEWSLPDTQAGCFGPDSRLEYGYCTEFVLQLMHYKTNLAAFDLQSFTKPLEKMGDSIVAVHNDGIVKIHIHTFAPEEVLGYGRSFGEFITVKIENMSVQHSQIQTEPQKEREKYAIVAVASGEGIQNYFRDIGATYIVDGGQTNNPPVTAFLEAFRKVNAEHIVVLPNNSNIILTANQAAATFPDSDVRVIPTKSLAEGYSALSMMNLWSETVEDLISDMTTNLDNVVTGYVTTAIRDAHMDGVDVKKGDYIGLDNKHIRSVGTDPVETAKALIRNLMETDPKDVVIVFSGKHVSADEVGQLDTFLQTQYPLVDIGFVDGKQEIYDFIISLE